jgi:site-specific recombinase XerD
MNYRSVYQNENTQAQNYTAISTKLKINVSKASINLFENSLISYEVDLNKFKKYLQNSSLSIRAYETSTEARRRAQLKTEETIADLKMLHGFDINDDESVLPPELQLEIEYIQNKLFYHYDLIGNLLKTVTLNSPLYKIRQLKLFKIDSTDKLYFTLFTLLISNNFVNFLYIFKLLIFYWLVNN